MAKKRKKKKSHVLGHVFLFLMLAAFAGGALYYAYEYQQWVGKFLPNTTVNGIDYSGMTAEEAEARFKETYAGRVLDIKEMGGSVEKISYDDLDYHFTTGESFRELIDAQDLYLWPLAYTKKTALTTDQGFAFSDELLVEKVKSLQAITGDSIQDPVDAYIEKTASGYRIVEAIDGNRLIEDSVIEAVRNAINTGANEINLEELGCYRKASVYADNEALQNEFATVDRYQNMEITLSMEGNTYVLLDKSVFLPWMSFENGRVSFDSDAVINYTQSLADQYNTLGKTRQFHTTGGDVLTVGGSNYDTYGYKMNVEQSADLIAGALAGATSQMIALAWDHYGLARDEGGQSDFGKTYIEVSLDEQHMYYYKDGALVLDPNIVSGTATPQRATPTMVTQVLDKKTDHTMKGSYGESHADFALVIHESGILIHDSSWRDEYGDDIWLYDGSHGCINTPLRYMEELYDQVDISTPVIIYDRYNHVTSFENTMYTGGPVEDEDDEDDDYDEDDYDEDFEVFNEDNYYEEENYNTDNYDNDYDEAFLNDADADYEDYEDYE